MKHLTKQQKLSLAGLIFLTILIFVIAFFQFRSTIYKPFRKAINGEIETEKIVETLNLKNVDTDKDGLNDFDELYIYKTSPYLDDTDSDGITDKEEVEQGEDPLCPKGKICGSSPATDENADEKKEETDLSIEDIKSFLIEAGISGQIIDNVDDKTLIEVYNETIKETGINPSDFSSEKGFDNISSELSQEDILGSLSIQEIRNLLIQEGVEKEILDQINDDDLREMLLQMSQ